MNTQNAAAYLPLIQALAEGKVIERRTDRGWKEIDDVIFSREPELYRIKPEAREFWINNYERGVMTIHSSKEIADSFQGGRVELIKVREILDT